mmetsp:Transcript_36265/g.85238  ORF Transcript_36265/g.85238 Transcript_36265/m.85238 type:complete len:228 (+) Transcript_36265:543-1226(+)
MWQARKLSLWLLTRGRLSSCATSRAQRPRRTSRRSSRTTSAPRCSRSARTSATTGSRSSRPRTRPRRRSISPRISSGRASPLAALSNPKICLRASPQAPHPRGARGCSMRGATTRTTPTAGTATWGRTGSNTGTKGAGSGRGGGPGRWLGTGYQWEPTTPTAEGGPARTRPRRAAAAGGTERWHRTRRRGRSSRRRPSTSLTSPSSRVRARRTPDTAKRSSSTTGKR